MSMLVFGQSGQVATELARQAETRWPVDGGRSDRSRGLRRAIRAHAPSAVINAAAYTAVDKRRRGRGDRHHVNGAAPACHGTNLRRAGHPLRACLDRLRLRRQRAAPRAPDATDRTLARPYGRSKLAGEEAGRAAGGACDPAHVLGLSAHGARISSRRCCASGADARRLRVVATRSAGRRPPPIRRGLPAHRRRWPMSRAIAASTTSPGAPDVSWAGFAARSSTKRARPRSRISRRPTTRHPAARPLNSRLDCQDRKAAFGIPRPDWRMGLADILKPSTPR
jgi:dTDP-4-dehydrorhamnose reductase